MERIKGLGFGVLLLAIGCDADSSGRANGAYLPGGDPEAPTSAVESLDFDAIAQSLVSQANTPVDPDAPGAEPPSEPEPTPEDDSGDAPDPGDSGDSGDSGEPEPPATCTGFECADGTCIDATWECDGIDDCGSAEDEANCAETCTGYTCGDGTCIQGDWVCDAIVDCADGSDEAACGVATQGFDLVGSRGPAKLDTSCVFSMTQNSAIGGAVAGEIVSKACTTGGVVVGLATAETGVGAVGGFGVAAVCGITDATQLDLVVGGVAGAVGGFVGGVTLCEGGIVDQASSFISWLWGSEPESIPVYNVQAPASSDEADDAELASVADSLLSQACNENDPEAAKNNCNLFFHYTDAAGYAGISGHPDMAILGDAQNRVFVTWIPYTPSQVRNELVFQGNNAGKGDYMFAFRLHGDVTLRPDTSLIELVHEGTLRLRTRAEVVYHGPNPMAVFE